MGLLLGLPSLASGSDLRPTQKDLIEVQQPKFMIQLYRSYVFNLETTSDQSSFVLLSSVQSFMIPDQPPSDQPPSDQSSMIPDQSPSNQPPSDQSSMTSSSSSFQPSVLETKNVNVVPVINLIFTAIGLFIAIFAFSIMAFMNIYTRIDNLYTDLGSKIDNGNQEMRELINSSIRDFNSRIDNVNGRIDNMYKAPSIEN